MTPEEKNQIIAEQIEKNLIESLDCIDISISYIINEFPGQYNQAINNLSDCKDRIKKELNQHFDRLAWNK